MDDKLSIKVKILDRIYPIKIDRKDEERIRKAVNQINAQAAKYRNHFSSYDAQDHISMVSIHLATKLLEYEDNKELDHLKDEIKQLTDDVSQFVENERSLS